MPRRPPFCTTRVSPDTNSPIAHAEAQDAPGFTTVRMSPRASMFAAIASASPRKPPGLSSSNVSNFGSAANLNASPLSIGPDARTVRGSSQMKSMAFGFGTAASKKATAIAMRLNIRVRLFVGLAAQFSREARDDKSDVEFELTVGAQWAYSRRVNAHRQSPRSPFGRWRCFLAASVRSLLQNLLIRRDALF